MGRDTVACEGFAGLRLRAPAGYARYRWSDGSTGMQLSAMAAGRYWLRCEHDCGTVTDTLVIRDGRKPLAGIRDTSLCGGASLVVGASAGFDSYRWSSGALTSQVTITQPGSYAYTVGYACGEKRDTFEVRGLPSPPPRFSLGPDESACGLEDTPLILNSPMGTFERYWSTGSNGPSISVEQSGAYWLRLENPCGIQSDTLTVNTCPDYSVYIPNAFTPNRDGLNELFGAVTYNVPSGTLLIYDRWGELVFQGDKPDARWDGTWQGRALAADTYTYKFVFMEPVGGATQTRSGTVVLVR